MDGDDPPMPSTRAGAFRQDNYAALKQKVGLMKQAQKQSVLREEAESAREQELLHRQSAVVYRR